MNSTEYYQTHPEARKKHVATSKKINQRSDQKKRRAELNLIRKKAKAKGIKIEGKDYDHAVGKFIKSSINRGRKGEGGRKAKSQKAK